MTIGVPATRGITRILDPSIQSIGRGLLLLLATTSIFQAVAITVGDSWYPPQLFLQLLLFAPVMLFVVSSSPLKFLGGVQTEFNVLLLFVAVCVLSAIVLPRMFAGLYILFPTGGIDDEVESPTLLTPSRGNIGQPLFLILNAAMSFGCVIFSNKRFIKKLLNAWLFGGGIALFFAFYQKLSILTGVYFPSDFLYSNEGYAVGYETLIDGYARVNSTFTEPSTAGNVFGAYFAYHLFEYRRLSSAGQLLLAILYITAIAMTASAVGYLEVIASIIMLMFGMLRRPSIAFIWLLSVGVTCFIAYSFLPDLIDSVLLNKASSGSFLNRTAADLFSLDLTLETHLLGVGLGSNRPSSFLMYLLSNIGIAGFILFVVYIYQVTKIDPPPTSFDGPMKAVRAALLAFIIGKVLAVPDLNVWSLWIMIGLIAGMKSQAHAGSRSTISEAVVGS